MLKILYMFSAFHIAFLVGYYFNNLVSYEVSGLSTLIGTY